MERVLVAAALSWAERVIRWVVGLYPSEVQTPHGEELVHASLEGWRIARRRGVLRGVIWWVSDGMMLLLGAFIERAQRAMGWGTLRHPGASWMDRMRADLGGLVRSMRRNAGFSTSLVGVLALALGLATAVFAFADGVLLKPLRYADEARIVSVWASRPSEGLERVPLTQWDVNRLRDRSDIFESVGGFTQQRTPMQLSDRVMEIGFGWITSGIHDVLEVEPILGRTFLESERGELVALLDHGFWQRQFGADPQILGKTMRIAQQTWTIVGVLPPDTPLELPTRGRVPLPVDVWSFMWVDGDDASSAWIQTVARLAPGVTPEQAHDVASQIAADARAEFPERAEWGFELGVQTLRADVTGGISRHLWLLLAATVVLLLAAITNAGNLMLLQRQRRRHRTAVRLAIGASKGRLSRGAVVEGLLYAGLAGGLALPISSVALDVLVRWSPADVPRLDVVGLDVRALMFLALSVVLAGTVLGVIAVAWTADVPTDDVIRPKGGRSPSWSGSHLVAAEVALAVPLLVVGALLARSASSLESIDPGFDTSEAVALRLGLPNHEIGREELSLILEDFHDQLRALPGVEHVGASNVLPLGGGAFTGPVAVEIDALTDPNALEADYRFVTPGYLDALGVERISGRFPDSFSDAGSAPTVVVDALLASRLWADGEAVGRTMSARPLGDARSDFTIVGVVGETRHEDLRQRGRPTVYFTSANYTIPYVTTVVRGGVAPETLFPMARQSGAQAHPDFLVADARSLDGVVDQAHALSTWLVSLVVALASGAALITGLGLYAIVGQFVSGYARSIGIRRALGARPAHLVGVVARRLMLVVGLGCGAGALLAAWASRYIESELVGVEPNDPLTWMVGAALLTALVVVATSAPTRSALAVSPVEALRSE
ncbi:MAG: ABC transporter permease [Gemmatimonadota bacterium]